MEAMKMEHTIKAPQDGRVDAFYYAAGDLVDGGAELLQFTATEASLES
jgi:3-methylcrotonyl-CoA carboxylase alpha subunit